MKDQKPSFEQAINASIIWCKGWEKEEISDEVLAERVSELLTSKDGTRGFFVASLPSNSPLMDRLPDPLILELRAGGENVVDITVKNLAMSSAMMIHHQRNGDLDQKYKSQRIQERCTELLRVLDTHLVKNKLESLLNSIDSKGSYTEFLQRWDYDYEQKLEIKRSIEKVAEQ